MSNNLTAFEQQLLSRPFDADLRLNYAGSLLAAGRVEDAKQQYELLVSQRIESPPILTGLAKCMLQLNCREEALDLYRSALDQDGFEPDAELDRLLQKARPAGGPELRVISGGLSAAVIPLKPVAEENVRFSSIIGMTELKKTLRLQIIEPYLRPGIFAKFRKKTGGGIILYGPPGCGKTMAAKAVAAECNAYFLSVGISDVLNMWLGESERSLAELFEKARANRPAVLFFDELDALAFSRAKARSESTRTVVNEFLAQLDGVNGNNEQILVMAATNMPWDVDPAMKRPGRFDRQVFVPPPDEEARTAMLRIKLADVPCDQLDYTAIARMSRFYSGADIDGFIDLAKEIVLSEIIESGNERNLTQQDLQAACARFHPSTLDWLKTARNLVKYAGADDAYRDVEIYLKANKLV
jgi:SpoVK/Ycf46/Vps4 family AAA+-type ATPase